MKRLSVTIGEHARRHREHLAEDHAKTSYSPRQAARIIERIDAMLAQLPAAITQAHKRIIGERQVPNAEKNRLLQRQDFANDFVDAGEIGAGHTVTALYEVVPVPAVSGPAQPVDPLRHQPPLVSLPRPDPVLLGELLTVQVRYKAPQGTTSEPVEFPFTDRGGAFADASGDFKFAASAAGFGMILRDSPHKGQATLDQVLTWAQPGLADDPHGHRAEFVDLIRRARDVTGG